MTYSYDAAGRRLTETTGGLTLTSSYDRANNRTQLIWPDGNGASFGYDALDRMTSTSMGGAQVTLGYDTLSRYVSETRGTGAATSLGYDGADRLISLAHSFSGSSANVTFGLGYTPADQLASSVINNTAYIWSATAASTVNKTADGLNRDASISDPSCRCSPLSLGR